ncbi:hypothetical protein SAMN02910358_00867 [Lachnospiraceae bacterium XBB1006]|nr:hypothetical protein SAMN02910358_00867 [Lachnospiraceae bacterium XBB1006]
METLGVLLGFALPLGVENPAESLPALGIAGMLYYIWTRRRNGELPVFSYAVTAVLVDGRLSRDLMTYIGRKSAWPLCALWLLVFSLYGQKKELAWHVPGEAELKRIVNNAVLAGLVILLVVQVPVFCPWLLRVRTVYPERIAGLSLFFFVISLLFGASVKSYLIFGACILCLGGTLPLRMLMQCPEPFLELGRSGGSGMLHFPPVEIVCAMVYWTVQFVTLRGCVVRVCKEVGK